MWFSLSLSQCGFHKIYEKNHPEFCHYKQINRSCHYKQIEHDLDFEGIKFPATNNDIQNFETHDNVSANVLEVDDATGEVVISRKLKNKDAKCIPL